MSAKSGPEIRMATENLVDAFEQVLGVAQHLSCEMRPGEYASCVLEQKQAGTENMLPAVMCATCRALWHLQMGKDLWVRLAKKWNKRWDPYKMIPDEDRADPADVLSLGSPVVPPRGEAA